MMGSATVPTITLAHGAGGRASDSLIRDIVLPSLGDSGEGVLCDSAVVASPGDTLAFTTDGFTVTPLFFPGGSIGRLAVFGTVNDLAMAGAVPRFLSLAMIAEEGLPLDILRRVLEDVGAASHEAGVSIVTGDTKVVAKGAADALFLTTSGVGVIPEGVPPLSPGRIRPGDVILVSGTMGDHGIAVLAARERLAFSPVIESDCAPLAAVAQRLLRAAPSVRCMRDPTRGGLAATLNEFAHASAIGIELDDGAIPVRRPVRALCEILGLDPLYLANEGKLVAVVDPSHANNALEALRHDPTGSEAAVIGKVTAEHPGTVVMRTELGTHRIVEYPTGELLPRIC